MYAVTEFYYGDEPGSIRILFNNGTEVVAGHIRKQIGDRKYVVSDGTNFYHVRLAKTPEQVADLPPGYATIQIWALEAAEDDPPEHVKALFAYTCYTVEGHRYGWRLGNADQHGEADIDMIE